MRIVLAAILALLALAAFTGLALRARRRPLPLAAAMGLALLVGWQAIATAALSALTAVNGVGLAVAALLPPLAVLAIGWRTGGLRVRLRQTACALRSSLVAYGWRAGLLAPLAAALTWLAAAHAPSNWDSMTYHLARVAHWIQRGSVGPYPTNVFRQTLIAPGAEYLLLGLQAIAASDRLAAGLQLVSWLLVAACAPPLARLAGLPRSVAGWAAPIVAAAPMLVLQATSTQNDLVASVMALGIVAASLPFLHRTPRAGLADHALLGTVVGAAFLVKATSIVFTFPFLVLALLGALRRWREQPVRRTAAALLAAAVPLAILAGPQVARMATDDPRAAGLTAPYVYAAGAPMGERLASVRAAVTRHFPAGGDLAADLAGRPTTMPPFHEDFAVNPVQAAVAVLGLALLALGWRQVSRRARWGGAAIVAGWLAFQVAFRANAWITRLESPAFALLPLALGGFALAMPGAVRQGVLGGAALASLLVGGAAVVHNPTRPLAAVTNPRQAADDYYANRREVRPLHDLVLDVAGRLRCPRIGLQIGEDSYDYPLTWRAMQRGIEVRHVLGPDRWPCVLLSDRGPPPPQAPGEAPWQPVVRWPAGGAGAGSPGGGVWVRPP